MDWTLYIYDPGWWPGENPDDEASAAAADVANAEAVALLDEFRARVRQLGGSQELRMPETCAGDSVGFQFLFGIATGLGASALTWLGGKAREFMLKRRRGASGDVRIMRAVALYHLSQSYLGDHPKPATDDHLKTGH